MADPMTDKTLLLIGASRGLGLALAEQYLTRGWTVVATERQAAGSGLAALAARWPRQLQIETLDINQPDQLNRLWQRLSPRQFDLLFVNAGVAHADALTIGEVSTEDFVQVMLTNALSPLRVVETLLPLVRPSGTVGIMSSGQGSIGNNEKGQHELYRGSKAALNMFMRSFAARHAGTQRTLLLMAPGWVRTEMGGPDARLGIEESIPRLVDTMQAQSGKPGLQYLDYLGRTVPW